jgi:DNA replication and repair protein RecF
MELRSLSVHGLRVLSDLELDTDADLVVITGPNGSGKTSILEAVHLLGTARSFRSRTAQDVIARDADALLVRGCLVGDSGESSRIGIERPRRGPGRMRMDGEDVRTAVTLARRLPLVVITPESQRLLSEGAEGRRRLVDWLMFHVEPSYQAAHARYRRALRQRNAALRQEDTGPEQRAAWCAEMGSAGEGLQALRSAWLGTTLPVLEGVLAELSRLPVSLRFDPGWEVDRPLEAQLLEAWSRDYTRGHSGIGPHRCDLRIDVARRPAQHVVSRGEAKVLTMAVMLGFAKVLSERIERRPLVLVDELASELDSVNRGRLSGALGELRLQTFVTAVSDRLVETRGWERVCSYRMEAGKALKMLQ